MPLPSARVGRDPQRWGANHPRPARSSPREGVTAVARPQLLKLPDVIEEINMSTDSERCTSNLRRTQ